MSGRRNVLAALVALLLVLTLTPLPAALADEAAGTEGIGADGTATADAAVSSDDVDDVTGVEATTSPADAAAIEAAENNGPTPEAEGSGLQALSLTGSLTDCFASSDVDPADAYMLRLSSTDNMVADIFGASTVAGADAIIWHSTLSTNQAFNLVEEDTGAGGETLYAIKSVKSGKVLDIYGGNVSQGANVIQWSIKAENNLNQLWRIVADPAHSGSVLVISAANPDYVLDATAQAEGSSIKVRKYDSWTATQSFTLVNLSTDGRPVATGTAALDGGVYTLAPTDEPGLRLDVPGGTTVKGTQLLGWTSNAQLNQHFKLTLDRSSGFYLIQPLVSEELYLDVFAKGRVPGTAVIQWSRTGTNQLWDIVADGNDYIIYSCSSGLALSINDDGQAVLADPAAADRFTLTEHTNRDALATYADGTAFIKPAGSSKQVDITGAAGAGAEAILWTANNQLNQKFYVVAVDADEGIYTLMEENKGNYLADDGPGDVPVTSTSAADAKWQVTRSFGGYLLQNQGSGRWLAVLNNVLSLTDDEDEATPFTFAVTYPIDRLGYYSFNELSSADPLLRLDLPGSSTATGVQLELWEKNTSAAQKFLVTPVDGQYFTLQNAKSRLAVDIFGGSTSAGAKIIQWTLKTSDNKNQLWRLVPQLGGGFKLESKASASLYIGSSSVASASMLTTTTDADALTFSLEKTTYLPNLYIVRDIRSVFDHGPKPAEQQKYIVLHDTEGISNPANIISGWASNGNRVAAHFIVDRDGTIYQCVEMDRIAHHAGYGDTGHNDYYGVYVKNDDMLGTQWVGSWASDYGMNSWSIGIEMVHVSGNYSYPYTDAQLKAVDDLIFYIDCYYGFESQIIDHKAWRSGNSDTSAEFAGYLRNYQLYRHH
ncbi:MAG: RICIN domain-containing protein [Coriobacteriales bacterium]|jgi:hypothetical protein|nr:RICIN domain-containing protein [Coriobacteriales bacterium]